VLKSSKLRSSDAKMGRKAPKQKVQRRTAPPRSSNKKPGDLTPGRKFQYALLLPYQSGLVK
jgi:hypothetical protein